MPQEVRDAGFAEFVADAGTSLLRDAYLLTGDDEAAEDVLRDGLARMYRGWDQPWNTPEADAAAFRAVVRSSLRHPHRRTESGLHVEGPADADTGWRLLAELPPRRRAAVVLGYLGVGDSRAAQALGGSTVALRQQRARGLAQFRAAAVAAGLPDDQDELQRLLRRALDDRADLSQHPPPELAGQTVTRVRRSARGRRLGIVAAATAVLVAMIALGTGTSGQTVAPTPRPSEPSRAAPSPSTTPNDPYDLVAQLPLGRPVAAVPRVEVRGDGTFFVGGSYEFRIQGEFMSFHRAGAGWLVQTHRPDWAGENGDAGAVLTYVRPGTRPRVVAQVSAPVAVSPDGRSFAHVESAGVPVTDRDGRPTLTIRATTTGALIRREVVDKKLPQLRVQAWIHQGIVLVSPWPEATLVMDPKLREYVEFNNSVRVVPSHGTSQVIAIRAGVRAPYCAQLHERLEHSLQTLGCGESVSAIDDGDGGWIVKIVSRRGEVRLLDVGAPPARWLTTSSEVADKLPLEEGSCLREGTTFVCPIHPVRYYNDTLQPVWVRWNPSTGRVERAPLPEGVEAIRG